MDTKQDKKIYTVTEVTRNIRILLEENFASLWVEGEISNFVHHTSGHMYFSVRDANSSLMCAMFRRSNQKLKFKLNDGMKVICFGTISVYEARGDYQLIVEEIEPKGIGALQLQFEQLKERLKKEGLFDPGHKVPIPYLPTRIGVVTSPTGAAIQDILNIARRRFSNVEIIINPVNVQGEGAKEEIANAINEFNVLKDIDVMIVTRGGGSLEDLWPFNEEIVARAIYASKIPVISAVGHEIDFTICDFAADFRAPTPSAAAELVIPRKEDLENTINTARIRLRNALLGMVDVLSHKLASLSESYVLRQPINLIIQCEQRIDDLLKNLMLRADHLVKIRSENFGRVLGKLEALSPLAILKRGYSITMTEKDGHIVKDANSLKEKDMIRTKLAKGEIVSRVEEIVNEK